MRGAMTAPERYTVLYIGDDVRYNLDVYKSFSETFTIIQPMYEERQRDAFVKTLREARWGDFHAVFRPFWNSGGEMGRWDQGAIIIDLPELSAKDHQNSFHIFPRHARSSPQQVLGTTGQIFPLSRPMASLTATVHALRLRPLRTWLSGTFSVYSGT